MHTQPMRDSDGRFAEWKPIEGKCYKCAEAGKINMRVWESNDEAFEDHQYKCFACGATWWIDGIDS